MKIKSYKARNTDEALQMVRNDMGPAALIVQTRKIKHGGIFGVMGSEAVEIVAATDDEPAASPTAGKHAYAALAAQTAGGALRRVQPAPDHRAGASTFKHLHDRLLAHGVLPQLARVLVDEAVCRFPSSAFANSFPSFPEKLEALAAPDDILHALAGAVANTIRVQRPAKPPTGPKIIVLVGPTGVGKTTTIAKLAVIAAMRHRVPTALATIDTYRIGAVDQLKTYSEMLGVPFATAQRPAQLKEAIEQFSDKAVVFVDTTGRSPNDRERVNAILPFLRELPHAETHLVVSCSTKFDDALKTADTFSLLPINRLIFSKVDEASSFGSIYNLAAKTQLPPSYLTVGQEVPDDIEVTTPGRLAELLLREAA